MAKLTPSDTLQQMVLKLADGNPGAINACLDIVQNSPLDSTEPLKLLDKFGIYGSDIYVLYSDLCFKSARTTIAVLNAPGLGILPAETIRDAASRQDYSGRELFDASDIYVKVTKGA